jgi:hypothetical protein
MRGARKITSAILPLEGMVMVLRDGNSDVGKDTCPLCGETIEPGDQTDEGECGTVHHNCPDFIDEEAEDEDEKDNWPTKRPNETPLIGVSVNPSSME